MQDTPSASRVLSVSELNRLARLALERALPVAWIGGELSNLTRAPSGHWYFTLKDDNAAIRCAMFRNRNQFVDWRPENGMQVEVRAQATLYEARGEYQLNVEAMRKAGLGALFEAFQRLKEALTREGLFDPERKRPLPPNPVRIGVVTSAEAAALRDVLTTLRRRWPLAQVVIYPSLVQGPAAAGQIVRALGQAGARRDCEVLLLVRGGGSIEDLWPFNEESVARAVAACPIPVISGIGHETDFTIADFAADVRAPTPTGAAQLATPDAAELRHRVDRLGQAVGKAMRRHLERQSQGLDGLNRRLRHPAASLAAQRRHVEHLRHRLASAGLALLERRGRQLERWSTRLAGAAPRLEYHLGHVAELQRRLVFSAHTGFAKRGASLTSLHDHLQHLNPLAVLERGYSVVRDQQGAIVRDSRAVAPGAGIAVTLAQGALEAVVQTRVLPDAG